LESLNVKVQLFDSIDLKLCLVKLSVLKALLDYTFECLRGQLNVFRHTKARLQIDDTLLPLVEVVAGQAEVIADLWVLGAHHLDPHQQGVGICVVFSVKEDRGCSDCCQVCILVAASSYGCVLLQSLATLACAPQTVSQKQIR